MPNTREAKLLAEMRNKRGWSQNELSRRSGVTQATISSIEGGKKIKGMQKDTKVKLAKAFRTSVDRLFPDREKVLVMNIKTLKKTLSCFNSDEFGTVVDLSDKNHVESLIYHLLECRNASH